MTWKLVILALVTSLSASTVVAQQVLEVDLSSGRLVVGGPQHGFRPDVAAVDSEGRVIHLVDASDPLAVWAVSLDDGGIRGVYGGRRGDGPGETRGIAVVAVGGNGLFISDGAAISRWERSGSFSYTWRPTAPGAGAICSFGDQPAVPLQHGGVAVRTEDGGTKPVGTTVATEHLRAEDPSRRQERLAAIYQYLEIMIACGDGVAYVLAGDDVLGYGVEGQTVSVSLPPEVLDTASRRRQSARRRALVKGYSSFFVDGMGRLVVTFWGERMAGAVIDPQTGCYVMLMDEGALRRTRRYVGMVRDSVVVLESDTSTQLVDGRKRTVIDTEPSRVIMRALNPVSGDACPATPPGQQPG